RQGEEGGRYGGPHDAANRLRHPVQRLLREVGRGHAPGQVRRLRDACAVRGPALDRERGGREGRSPRLRDLRDRGVEGGRHDAGGPERNQRAPPIQLLPGASLFPGEGTLHLFRQGDRYAGRLWVRGRQAAFRTGRGEDRRELWAVRRGGQVGIRDAVEQD